MKPWIKISERNVQKSLSGVTEHDKQDEWKISPQSSWGLLAGTGSIPTVVKYTCDNTGST